MATKERAARATLVDKFERMPRPNLPKDGPLHIDAVISELVARGWLPKDRVAAVREAACQAAEIAHTLAHTDYSLDALESGKPIPVAPWHSAARDALVAEATRRRALSTRVEHLVKELAGLSDMLVEVADRHWSQVGEWEGADDEARRVDHLAAQTRSFREALMGLEPPPTQRRPRHPDFLARNLCACVNELVRPLASERSSQAVWRRFAGSLWSDAGWSAIPKSEAWARPHFEQKGPEF